ncbi:M20/M25/M40 family metallo-hydrolase [Novosphingobium mangrovi (ex Hu et al. 2023)]|uniref:Vacuolar membrane protease n=1 Tax=Novosphingobium mangrovi (ex Hu et al. 2023) TaxID=2930094 RepID=A0ABT0A983_9SPHN|nr:M20/M25/M40 family metallo-hydrolase [Novosphingobium mangrovi (ex Hu et al. 2023)]MCJ1959743.1 M20/M25/M40 family metallo-hydrolase [Novosphingobium mangrovi (ex Hu et al. 2023)]
MLCSAVLCALVLAIMGTTPPSPRGQDAPGEAFSAERAMAHVDRIARRPHPSGSAEIAQVRALLSAQLREQGLVVREQAGAFDDLSRQHLNARAGLDRAEIPLVNVVAQLPGRDPSLPGVALMAHYDSVEGSPGAADDGAGVATILETVRALKAGPVPARTLYVLLTDGEEAGLRGARMFFEAAPEAERIGAIINLEARGGGGVARMFQTSRDNGEVAGLWAKAARHPGGDSLSTFIYAFLPNDTDLTVALERDYAAWNFAFIGRPELYHSPQATPANLDRGSLQQMGDQTLGLTRALLGAEHLPEPAPGRVFFDVFGLFVLDYAPVWGWVMLALAVAGGGLAVAGRVEGCAALSGLVRMLVLLVGSALVFTGLNMLSVSGEGVNYYDRLAAIQRLQAMVALAAVALAVATFGRKPRGVSGDVGAMVPILLLGGAAQALAPVAAYPLTIPLMLTGLAAGLRRFVPAGLALVVDGVVAAVSLGYGLTLGFLLMQGVGPDMPGAVALPLGVAVMTLLPLRPQPLSRGTLAICVTCLLTAAVAVAAWVRFDDMAATIATYS